MYALAAKIYTDDLGLKMRDIKSSASADSGYSYAAGSTTINVIGTSGGFTHLPEEVIYIDKTVPAK